MKTIKRSKKRLPSPLKVSFYLMVVAVCCLVNWSLLKADNIVQHHKSIDLSIAEEMLEQLDPVEIPAFHMQAYEYSLELQNWMLNIEAYKPVSAINNPALEDWMISTSSWIADN